MSLDLVQNALMQQFRDHFFPEWENLVAYENTKFVKPNNGQWMEYNFMPASDLVATLGTHGLDKVAGIVQITLVLPQGVGEENSRETINKLRTCFKPGLIQYSGQPVSIFSRGRSPGRPSDGFWKIPFTVYWRAQLNR